MQITKLNARQYKTHLIIDRDTKFTEAFKNLLKNFGVELVLCPVRAPKCNAYAERFVRSIKYECLNRTIPLGEGQSKLAINQYLKHYNGERNHQGIENQLIKPEGFELGRGGKKQKTTQWTFTLLS